MDWRHMSTLPLLFFLLHDRYPRTIPHPVVLATDSPNGHLPSLNASQLIDQLGLATLAPAGQSNQTEVEQIDLIEGTGLFSGSGCGYGKEGVAVASISTPSTDYEPPDESAEATNENKSGAPMVMANDITNMTDAGEEEEASGGVKKEKEEIQEMFFVARPLIGQHGDGNNDSHSNDSGSDATTNADSDPAAVIMMSSKIDEWADLEVEGSGNHG